MANRTLNIVFFGTADFAVPSLEALIAAGHNILAVVTQPDKPQGRGLQLAASPVKKAAQRLGLEVLQPKRVRSERFLATMRELQPDILALAAFGQIVPQALLELPPLGPINVHGSLLPQYRGAAPIQRAIMAGELVTGVTTMWMDASLDTGDILLADSIPIEPDDTSGTLFTKLAELGAALLVRTVEGLANGTIERKPQDDASASLSPAITSEDTVVDWTSSAKTIADRMRGLLPRPGLFTEFHGKRIKLLAAVPVGEGDPNSLPGSVVSISKHSTALTVAAGSSTLLQIDEIQPDSGKRMPAASWARGARILPGDRLGAPTPQ